MREHTKVGRLWAASLIVILFPTALMAWTTFKRTYGGPSHDLGYFVQQTSDEGYIITGSTESYGAGGRDVWLIKTNSNGDTLWTRVYGGPYRSEGLSVQQTSDGGYIVAGYTYSFGAGQSDLWLIKTDSDGDTLWTRTYGGTGGDGGHSVQQTSDGGYIVTGNREYDLWLIKTDSNGDTLWTRTYSDGDGWSVQQTSDGGYIITGSHTDDLWLIKTGGNISFERTYGGRDPDIGYSVQQTSDGGYIVTGMTESYGAGAGDLWLIRTDSNGDTLWTKTYGGPYYDIGWSVQQTSGGEYIIAGRTDSYGAGGRDVWLIKTDSNGDTLWAKTYGGSDTDEARSVQQTLDGGYIIAGRTHSYGVGGYSDVWLIKTDASGNVDTTPPAAPTNLTATPGDRQVSLTWSKNLDADMWLYRIYRDTTTAPTTLIDSTFHSDTTYTDTGLTNGQTYYYRVTAVDSSRNESGHSNEVSAIPADTISPARITDLSANPKTPTSITLSWTAPSDDGFTGTASQYDIRYSTSPVGTDTSTWWAGADTVANEPTPQPAGSTETFTVGNLSSNTAYHFAIKAADEVPNWSAISNIDSATTSPQLVVSLPDTEAASGATVLIPVTLETEVTPSDSIYSVWMTITSDPSVALPGSASVAGTIAEDWWLAHNVEGDSSIVVAMADSLSLEGSGPLVFIEYSVIGSPCDTTELHFADFMFNEGVPTAITHDGSLHVAPPPSISGNIYYYSNQTPLSSVLVHLYDDTTAVDTTDENGYYEFKLGSSSPFTVKPEKEVFVKDPAITPYDASLALREAVDLISLDPYQLIAGDVSGNDTVAAYDASLILQYCVSLVDSFDVMPDSTHLWRFVPTDFPIDSTNWPQAPDSARATPPDTVDFVGILYGDISGNWPSTRAMAVREAKGKARLMTLGAGEAIHGEPGNTFTLPIRLDDGTGIVSTGFTVSYDPRILKAVGASTTQLTSGYIIAHNPVEDGKLKVALAGSKPIDGSGAIAEVEFKVLEDAPQGASCWIRVSEVQLNEGMSVATSPVEFTVGRPVSAPTEFGLSQNYPNPFNATTTIRYQLPVRCKVSLRVYNVLGQLVRTVVDEEQPADYYTVRWDGRNEAGKEVASGVYFYWIQAGEFTKARKMILLK